jgi:hypothetical protein
MKTIYRTTVLLMSVFLAITVFSAKFIPASVIPIHVVISSKAYWDGPTKSCLPRVKGGCCHIWIEGMVSGQGEISGEMDLLKGNIFQLTVSKDKGMNNETYLKYFSDEKFILDGPITFDPGVLKKLGIDGNYVVSSGTYPVTTNGELLTITFN